VGKHDIRRKESEIHKIKMKVWWPSFGIDWNIMNTYMENPRKKLWLLNNS
jgi:hypothetical protein